MAVPDYITDSEMRRMCGGCSRATQHRRMHTDPDFPKAYYLYGTRRYFLLSDAEEYQRKIFSAVPREKPPQLKPRERKAAAA